jgi:hypothetical protein
MTAVSTTRVLFSSSFVDPLRRGHGGNRRAQQLLDLLEGANLAPVVVSSVRDSIAEGLRRTNWSTVAQYARQVHLGPLRRARGVARFARNYGDWRRSLARTPEARVLVWEDSGNVALLRAAKDAGLRVVAVPQNLETLVPGSREIGTQQSLPWSFEYEVEQLAAADSVYTISREEQWLLRLRGVAAEYLPFFPDPGQRRRWLELRAQRTGPFDRFVALGSAWNPPTRAGMRDLLAWMSAAETPPLPVHVVGYGTEVMRDLHRDGLEIHGALDDEALEAHLRRARAVLLHQPAAVGALIRVSEMLLAGIPVLANPIAARSTSQYEGVTTYESFTQLGTLLRRQDWEAPPIPMGPSELERAFVQKVIDWAG